MLRNRQVIQKFITLIKGQAASRHCIRKLSCRFPSVSAPEPSEFFRVLGRVGRGGQWSVHIRPLFAKHEFLAPVTFSRRKKSAGVPACPAGH